MIKTDGMRTQIAEGRAFFLKMVGDYYRYMAESAQGDVLSEAREGALKHYREAETACQGLRAWNPIKLGLANSFSVFHYDLMKDFIQACQLAETALKDAMNKMDDFDEQTLSDAKIIIEILKENLTVWKKEEERKNIIDTNW
jgi:hypothetical protein